MKLKKTWLAIVLTVALCLPSSTIYAAQKQIIIDGVAIVSDVAPEMQNQRVMVPVRVLGENLGATVEWVDSRVILTKDDMTIVLTPNSSTAEKNGKTITLDTQPYMKNYRVFVPLRFIAETFGCTVDYNNNVVTVETQPLLLKDVQVAALQYEYHMTMGGVVRQVTGNAYNETIYTIFAAKANKEGLVEEPAQYSWMMTIDQPGSYYKNGQFDFLDRDGNSLARYDVYSLIRYFPEEMLAEYPGVLLHDASQDVWYLFDDASLQAIYGLMDTAEQNGFLKEISNTVV